MPHVNPRILEWARTTAGLSPEEAAGALGIASAERILAYEKGDEPPSRALLLRMSKQYRRSLLTFYLSVPPRKGDRGHDFRTLPVERAVADDVNLDALIRDLQGRQELVRAILQEEEERAPLAFVGSARMEMGREALGASIRETLRFQLAEYRACRTGQDAFAYLRSCAEEAGVFVLLAGNLGSHHTAIPVDVFRGFAIADPIAPFVVINDQDSKSAWSFTLLHEIAHLWLGTTGVSGSRGEQAIEQFCNDVAGELLLPSAELAELVAVRDLDPNATINLIADFAVPRKVSRQMVAYKLFRAGLITRINWEDLDRRIRQIWREERSRQREREREREFGPTYYVVRRHRLGRALLAFASRNMAAGALSTTKAARVLGVRPRSVFPLLLETLGPNAKGTR